LDGSVQQHCERKFEELRSKLEAVERSVHAGSDGGWSEMSDKLDLRFPKDARLQPGTEVAIVLDLFESVKLNCTPKSLSPFSVRGQPRVRLTFESPEQRDAAFQRLTRREEDGHWHCALRYHGESVGVFKPLTREVTHRMTRLIKAAEAYAERTGMPLTSVRTELPLNNNSTTITTRQGKLIAAWDFARRRVVNVE
jgi:hypothetical protein